MHTIFQRYFRSHFFYEALLCQPLSLFNNFSVFTPWRTVSLFLLFLLILRLAINLSFPLISNCLIPAFRSSLPLHTIQISPFSSYVLFVFSKLIFQFELCSFIFCNVYLVLLIYARICRPWGRGAALAFAFQ